MEDVGRGARIGQKLQFLVDCVFRDRIKSLESQCVHLILILHEFLLRSYFLNKPAGSLLLGLGRQCIMQFTFVIKYVRRLWLLLRGASQCSLSSIILLGEYHFVC